MTAEETRRVFHRANWAAIPVRLIVGYGFMAHGFAKLSRGPEAFVNILHAMGVPAAHFVAWVTILTKVLGGLAIVLGAFVAYASLLMAVVRRTVPDGLITFIPIYPNRLPNVPKPPRASRTLSSVIINLGWSRSAITRLENR
jgi:DoxX